MRTIYSPGLNRYRCRPRCESCWRNLYEVFTPYERFEGDLAQKRVPNDMKSGTSDSSQALVPLTSNNMAKFTLLRALRVPCYVTQALPYLVHRIHLTKFPFHLNRFHFNLFYSELVQCSSVIFRLQAIHKSLD